MNHLKDRISTDTKEPNEAQSTHSAQKSIIQKNINTYKKVLLISVLV